MAKVSKLKFVTRAMEGAVLQFPRLVNEGEPIPWIRFMGADSPKAKQFRYASDANLINAVKAARLAGEHVAENVVTAQELEERDASACRLLAALTMEWGEFEDEDGSAWPCTEDNALALFAENHEIVQEALVFLDDRARFFAQSSPTSAPSANTVSS